MERKALTVSQVGTYIKNIFDAEEMLHDIDVVGEISGFSITRDIAYFSLKDENSLLSCVLFGASKYANIKNGDSVVVTGTPRYYVKGGKLNFNATKILPYGQGLLFKQFLELKQKLELEGLFATEHKKPIPKNVKTIGVVTSEGGAVIQDIINVSTRRNPQINIVLYPVKVQGNKAENEIVKGIEFFSEYPGVDVVIVARGGGSIEDLQPYNTEIVARATYACQKPIVSAVGHETDFTIIDFVSDLRAPTPSAAAELVCENKMAQIELLKKHLTNLKVAATRFVVDKQRSFQMRCMRLEKDGEALISIAKTRLTSMMSRLQSVVLTDLSDKNYALGLLQKSLEKLNPVAVLGRGYAKVEIDGKAIESVEGIEVGQKLTTYFKDGKVASEVQLVERRKK